MQISKATDYAVCAMMHLAMNNKGEVSHISSISETWDVPEKFLRKISGLLAKHNLIRSSRGCGGGIKLAKDADEITLLEIVEAIESSVYFNRCTVDSTVCDNSTWCPVSPIWDELQSSFHTILGGVTLKELVSKKKFISNFKKRKKEA